MKSLGGQLFFVIGLVCFSATSSAAETYLKGKKLEERTITRSKFEQAMKTPAPAEKYNDARMSSHANQTTAGPAESCYGACCDPFTGSCFSDVYVYECDGNFTPGAVCGEITCPPLGACCHLNKGVCTDNVPITECPEFPAGDWYQDLSCGDIQCEVPVLGACCEENFGTCMDGVTEIDCLVNSLLGTFEPNATCDEIACPSTGACCNSLESLCTDPSTIVECFSSGADTITLGASCDQIDCPLSGACCDFASNCTDDVPFFLCDGTLWDPTLTCDEIECPIVTIGSCCLAAEEVCFDGLPEPDCIFGAGGTWTAETSCDQIECPLNGACCRANLNECTDDVSHGACDANSGLWYSNQLCANISCSGGTSCGGVNQSFETGNFAGWVVQDMAAPFFPITVAGNGITSFGCFFGSEPTEGNFAAVHGWDGGGPDVISMSQEMSLPQNITVLKYDYRASWLLTFGASLDRTFQVTLQPTMPGNPLWGPELVLTAPAGGIQGDTGNKTGGIDVSALAGSQVRLLFEWLVPEPFVGPAQFQLDNVRCDSPVLNAGGHAGFVHCFTGPGDAFPSKECTAELFQQSDAVGSDRVDLRDFRVLSLGFTP